MKKNIVVIFGGVSSEHDISIITAHQALNSLDKTKYQIMPIYIAKSGKWYSGKKLLDINTFNNFTPSKDIFEVVILPSSKYLFKKGKFRFKKLKKVDCVVTALHGVNGEDGSLQGLFELAGIAYTSSNVLSSSICMDKVLMKRVFESLDFKILPYFYVQKKGLSIKIVLDKIIKSFGFPVIIKPANLGSSIGITMCDNEVELKEGLQIAMAYDKKIIVEKAVKKIKEINCSVLGYGENAKASVLEEPVNWKNFLTFEEKYLKETGKNFKGGMHNLSRIMPAKISKIMQNKIKEMSLKAFKEFECSGVVRIDYIIDKETKELYINEINTIPGSFSFYLWEYEGVGFKELLDNLINNAFLTLEDKKENKYSYKSEVLVKFLGNDSNKLSK